jgi:hypothetical protein
LPNAAVVNALPPNACAASASVAGRPGRAGVAEPAEVGGLQPVAAHRASQPPSTPSWVPVM